MGSPHGDQVRISILVHVQFLEARVVGLLHWALEGCGCLLLPSRLMVYKIKGFEELNVILLLSCVHLCILPVLVYCSTDGSRILTCHTLHLLYDLGRNPFKSLLYLAFILCIWQQFRTSPKTAGEFHFQRLCLFLRNCAFALGTLATIVYWSLMRTNINAFAVHCHLVNFIAILIDLIICDTPVFMIQYTAVMCLTAIYGVMTRVVYGLSCEDLHQVVYSGIIDWKNDPRITNIFMACIITVILPSLHALLYGIYMFRSFLVGRCVYRTYDEAYDKSSASQGSSKVLYMEISHINLDDGRRNRDIEHAQQF